MRTQDSPPVATRADDMFFDMAFWPFLISVNHAGLGRPLSRNAYLADTLTERVGWLQAREFLFYEKERQYGQSSNAQ